MPPLLAVIEELVIAVIIGEKSMIAGRSAMGWAFASLSAGLGIAGTSLLILSLDRFLEKIYPMDIAALILAGVVFAAAALAAMVARYFRRHKAPGLAAARQQLGKNIRLVIEDICSEMDEPVRENPKTAILLAALAGFAAAQQTR